MNFDPKQMVQQVAQEAGKGGTGFFGGIMSALMNGPIGFAKGVVGHVFSIPTLMWGGAIMLAQAIGLAGPIANAIGGEKLKQQVADWSVGKDKSNSIWRRLMVSMGIGAAINGTIGGVTGAVDGVTHSFAPAENTAGKGHNVGAIMAGGALAILATSVVVGAVKNGNIKLGGEGEASKTAALPAKAAPVERGQS